MESLEIISSYVILEMGDYEKKEAAIKLMMELEKGRISGKKEGWHTLEEIRKEYRIIHSKRNYIIVLFPTTGE